MGFFLSYRVLICAVIVVCLIDSLDWIVKDVEPAKCDSEHYNMPHPRMFCNVAHGFPKILLIGFNEVFLAFW